MKRNGFPYAVVFWLFLLTPVLVAIFIQVRNDQAPDDSQAASCGFLNEACCTSVNSTPNFCLQDLVCQSDNVCRPSVTNQASCSIPGVGTFIHGQERCGAETGNQYILCDNGNLKPQSKCCNGQSLNSSGTCGVAVVDPIQVSPGGSCTPNETIIDVCTGSGICCSCSSGSKCLGSGFNSCTEYCGGSVTTPDPDPVDPINPPVQPDPGTTGSSCSASAPVKAKLISPGNGAVVNSTSVTLSWERNGSWGVGCPENDNEFRVRVAVVDTNSACPSDTSLGSYSRVGVVEGGPTGSFNMSVENGKKYCWVIRKNNGSVSTDSGVRSFSVNIEAPIDPGIDTELTGGGSFVDEQEGEVLGILPDSAIDNPGSLIVSILGVISILLGIKLYHESKLSRKQSSYHHLLQ